MWDFALSYDIGLAKLRTGFNVAICVAAGMFFGGLVGFLIGLPLQEGMTFGAAPAFQLSFAVSDRTWQKELSRSLIDLIPMSLSIAVAISLHAFRPVELVIFVGVLSFMLYAGRISVLWADVSMGIFSTFVLGLLIPVPVNFIPVIVLLTVAGGLGAILVRLAVSRPDGRRSLHFAQLGYWVQVRNVFRATRTRMAAGSASPKEQAKCDRALARAVSRLRAAALQATGLTSVEGSQVSRDLGVELSRLIFDTELGAELVSRSAVGIGGLRPALRGRIISLMEDLDLYDFRHAKGPDARVLTDLSTLPSFAYGQGASCQDLELVTDLIHNITWLADLNEDWRSLSLQADGQTDVPFESAIEILPGGKLPGTFSVVKQTAEHNKLSAQARTAIQAVIALSIMEPLGLLISDQRFYWGDIGVMVVLAGTFTQRERVRKTWARVWGTVVGGVIGLALAYFIHGNGVLTVAIIIVALACGAYFVSTKYAFWVVGLVVALCQLYASTGALSIGLIALRLLENGLGATIACVVSSLVLPIRSYKVLRVNLATIFGAIAEFAEGLERGEAHSELRSVASRIELGIYQLETGSLYSSNILRIDNAREALVQARLQDVSLIVALIAARMESADSQVEDLDHYCRRVGSVARRLRQLVGVEDDGGGVGGGPGEAVVTAADSEDGRSCGAAGRCELPQTREAQLLVRLGEGLEEVGHLLVQGRGAFTMGRRRPAAARVRVAEHAPSTEA